VANPFRALMSWYYKRCRRIDIQTLWPACCREAEMDATKAKLAFAYYAFHDPAWMILGAEEIYRRIDALVPVSRERVRGSFCVVRRDD